MLEELRFFLKITFSYHFVNNFGNKYDYVFPMLRIAHYRCKGLNSVVHALLPLWDRKPCALYILRTLMII